MTADITTTPPRRRFLDWIALARRTIAEQRGQPRRLIAQGRIPDHLLDDLGLAPIEFDHSGQLYERK